MLRNVLVKPWSIILHTTATMICRQCLRRASALRPQSRISRFISTTPAPAAPPAATATDAAAPQFSNPLAGTSSPSKPRPAGLPVSSAPAGTQLKGINYLKNAEDPVALPEEEYPEWLWRCLDAKKDDNAGAAAAGDEFCMHPLSTNSANVWMALLFRANCF
jgi:large subunit ribosomal protein L54